MSSRSLPHLEPGPAGLTRGHPLRLRRAHDVATDKGHKTIAATHVLEAVTQLGWEDDQDLVKHLKTELAGL